MDVDGNEALTMLKTSEEKQTYGSIISFQSIDYTYPSKKYCHICLSPCLKKKKPKQILFNLTGIFKPGMNAILGPTGSGKSTLLDILADRKNHRGLTGQVLIDGQTKMQDFKYRVGYVSQVDMLCETLSVRENLTFSANVRLPLNISTEAKIAIIDQVIGQLGLEKCVNSRVGTENRRGISGGERRRTNIGMELVLSPSVLFLDEPTTGLDSSTASNVIECLDRLSKRGHTIIFSIHQPRYSIFKLFNTLFLIAAGHCIYHGPTFDILPFFASVGFTCEEHDNAADFILDVSQGIRSASSSAIEIDTDLNQRKDKLARDLHYVYMKSPIYGSIYQEITDRSMLSNGILHRQTQLMQRSCLMEMFYVSQRTLRNSFRNSAVMIVHTIVPVCLALLIGLLYLNTDRTLSKGIKNRLGSIFFIVTNQVFLNLSALELFIKERQLFIHENASGYYHMSTYFISKLICDIFPMRLIPSILFSVIVYFLIGFQRTVSKFFIFLLGIFATSVCTSSVIFFLSASVPDFGVGSQITGALSMTLIAYSGYILEISSIVKFLQWIKWISIFRYAANILSINEFTNLTLCLTNNTNICSIKGEDILNDQNIDHLTSWDLWKNFVALSTMTLVFFVLSYIQLLRIKKMK